MAQPATTNDNSLDAGDPTPELSLPTNGNGSISIAEFKGKKNVVVYFYPKDNTPGCTNESRDFRDLHAEFEAANTAIIGVSKDSVKSHDNFVAKLELPFPLASDENSDVCERWGTWTEKNMYGKKYMGIQRATFLINKNGTIARIWPKVKVPGHAAEVLEATKQL